MSALTRTVRVAEMLARDLLRRRLTLLLIVALPLTYYFSQHGSQKADQLVSGGVGASWAIAGAALFATLHARDADQRLVLDGYRPGEILAGRSVLLLTGGLVLAGALGALMLAVTGPHDVADLAIAMAVVVGIAVPMGLMFGAAVPRELEGMLLLIAVLGIQIGLGPGSAVVGALPMGGAQRLLFRAGGGDLARAPSLARAIGWMLILAVLASVAWYRRVGAVAARRGGRRTMAIASGAVVAACGVTLAVVHWPTSSGPAATSGCLRADVPTSPVVPDVIGPPFFVGLAHFSTAVTIRGSDGYVYVVYGGADDRARGELVVTRLSRNACQSRGQFQAQFAPSPPSGPMTLTGVRGDIVAFTAEGGAHPGHFDVVGHRFLP
ncbi:MAG: hypothetical protein ACYDH6_07605 [Acidimicrobiales bacterium]